ncbi:hypothetical protein [Nocardia gipuzkoensis]
MTAIYHMRPVSARGEFLAVDGGIDTPDFATVETAGRVVKFLRGSGKIPGIARTKAYRYDYNGDRGYYRTTARYWAVNEVGSPWLELWTLDGTYLGHVPPNRHGVRYTFGSVREFLKSL